jgi:hypothetical protein
MRMAKGHETEGIVLRLIKSVYGLREAPIFSLFERLLSGWLTDMGFERLQSDKSIFKLDVNGRFLIVATYVDDIIILHKRDEDHEWFLNKLREKAKIKDLGTMTSILRIKVDRSEVGSITLSRPTAVEKLLVTAGMQNIRSVAT